MMSLSKVKLPVIVKKQYFFKLKANVGLLNSLIILQLFGILFSMGGTGASSSSYYHITYHTADFMIGFTIIWAFMIAVQLMSKDYRDHDFTVVTNRLATNLSNMLFLLTASIFGAITAVLSGYLSKVIIYFAFKPDYIAGATSLTFTELIFGFFATILYIFLFSMFGYLVGSIIQLNRAFIILLPVFALGFIVLAAQDVQFNLLLFLFEFYFSESIFFLFLLKVVVASLLFFISATFISNRLEVKQ